MRLRRLAVALVPVALVPVAMVSSCTSLEPPPVRFDGPRAVTRAGSAMEAARTSQEVEALLACVADGRPGHEWKPLEVWLRPPRKPEEETPLDFADGAYYENEGLLWVRGAESARRLHVLAHELAHGTQSPFLSGLPDVLVEGLCELVATECVPAFRAKAVATRIFAAMVGGLGTDYSVEYRGDEASWPGSTVSSQRSQDVDLSSILMTEIDDLEVDGDRRDAIVRGFGFLIASEWVHRYGWEGISAQSAEALADMKTSEASTSVLSSARLESARQLDRVTTRLIGQDVQREIMRLDRFMLGHMLYVEARFRFKAESLDEYLERGRPVIRVKGTSESLATPLEEYPFLIEAMRVRWHGGNSEK